MPHPATLQGKVRMYGVAVGAAARGRLRRVARGQGLGIRVGLRTTTGTRVPTVTLELLTTDSPSKHAVSVPLCTSLSTWAL